MSINSLSALIQINWKMLIAKYDNMLQALEDLLLLKDYELYKPMVFDGQKFNSLVRCSPPQLSNASKREGQDHIVIDVELLYMM